MRNFFFAAATFFALAAAPAAADVLDPMFQDHAVLQRDRPIPIWGEANPHERVTLTFNGRTYRSTADANGQWRTNLRPASAGGPFTIEARTRSGAAQTISDILVGDVFLCSGQSNMEWSVAISSRGGFEVARSANDRIRLMNIAHVASPMRLEDFAEPTSWAIAGPDTVGSFSGACYFFARELQPHIDVPIGLIGSSWGGSNIKAWLTDPSLRDRGGFDHSLDLLALYARDSDAAYAAIGEDWQNWWRSAAPNAGEPWMPNAGGDWRPLPEPMRDWKKWGVPETANLHGMVWFRRTVTLTAEQAAQGAQLALGAIDEVDQTWVNGVPIANSFGWSTPRNYELPAGALHEGDNTIVVNVLSTWDMGGMYGPPEAMSLTFENGDAVPLGDEWRYQLAPTGISNPPRAPWESVGGLTSLYNAMIAPIGPYGLRGAAWYQGESNTGDPRGQYQDYLAALMQGWRAQFTADLPFLIIQLPNFGPAPTTPVASGWANLREEQRRAVAADEHAALIVTIDIGDNNDLHPPNKQALGRRMARAARAMIYGEAISPSGPAATGARRQGDDVIVSFANIEGELRAYSAAGPIAFELCGANQAMCRFVNASIVGDEIVLPDPGAAAENVRFCWGEGPFCNLYDASGLPAGPFELAIE